VAAAAHRLGAVPGGDPRPAGIPRADRGLPDADLRPPLRAELLPARGARAEQRPAAGARRLPAPPGRLAAALAASLLVPGPPRGVHPDAAGARLHLGPS